jgi:phenylpyruvate tautomerase PptA (4-oxalocrotonate tautomerase family)
MSGKFCESLVSIEGENMRKFTWVFIEEMTSGNLGIGGTPLTTFRKPWANSMRFLAL